MIAVTAGAMKSVMATAGEVPMALVAVKVSG